jgi:predicted RNA-binding Zn-ribbon protein involved in translation (DUF1610 family)
MDQETISKLHAKCYECGWDLKDTLARKNRDLICPKCGHIHQMTRVGYYDIDQGYIAEKPPHIPGIEPTIHFLTKECALVTNRDVAMKIDFNSARHFIFKRKLDLSKYLWFPESGRDSMPLDMWTADLYQNKKGE